MLTFLIGTVILVVGYLFYGKFIESIFLRTEKNRLPAYTKNDGVDYLPLDSRKNALIQLLNIAGTGPIFGAILGASFGPVALLIIPIGNIFAGAVHDYSIGMISVRNEGKGLPFLAHKYLGEKAFHFVNVVVFTLVLLVGVVFVKSPADLISLSIGGAVPKISLIIFFYFLVATLLPIDKLIGKIYPIFGLLLLISTLGIFGGFFFRGFTIPELSLRYINSHPQGLPIFPLFFTTVTCGLISGFHATQSPIVARTLKKESSGRFVFFGMMALEGFIAMVWAYAAIFLFHNSDILSSEAFSSNPAYIVVEIVRVIFGEKLIILAIAGIVILPVTSGDTAFRSLRLMVSDYLNYDQKKTRNRLLTSIPFFVIGFFLVFYIDFLVVWRYFAWANQILGAIVLFISSVYLYKNKLNYWVSLVPATFLAYVSYAYILNAKIGFGFSWTTSYSVGGMLTVFSFLSFFVFYAKKRY